MFDVPVARILAASPREGFVSWVQQALKGDDGKLCLLGGLWAAVVGYENTGKDVEASSEKEMRTVAIVILQALRARNFEGTLINYNNHPFRTYEEIDSLLAEAKGYC